MFRENNLRPGDARRAEESWAKEEIEKTPENQIKQIKELFFSPENIDEDCGYLVEKRLTEEDLEKLYSGAKIIMSTNQDDLIKLLEIERKNLERIRYAANEIIKRYESLSIPEAIEVDEREAA